MSAAALHTDRQHLAQVAYGNGGNLTARADLYRYQTNAPDLRTWALDQMPWRGDEQVFDVGCGYGSYLQLLAERGHRGALCAIDLSPGMLGELRRKWHGEPVPICAVADVAALPLPDQCCDVVLAMHMLYHAADIAPAVQELRRVLRPGGTLLVVTNGALDKQALRGAYDEAVAMVAGHEVAPYFSPDRRFTLDNGATLLATAFAQVERRDLVGEVVLPEPLPALRYVASSRPMREAALPVGVTWDTVMDVFAQRVTTMITEQGAFRAQSLVGLFVCS